MKSISLFDMDGTLCVSRQKAPIEILDALFLLSKYSDIGIVSGSPMNYIEEQLPDLLDLFKDTDMLKIMPCNGTQLYESIDGEYKLVHSLDMKEEVGIREYHTIVKICNNAMSTYLTACENGPVSGNFISYRNSLLNFCPPGRDATNDDREKFENVDKELSIRKRLLKKLRKDLKEEGIESIDCTLGGYTSIDIYPTGWDKTYCLTHLNSYKTVTFVGDKCVKPGNDYTIYEALMPNSFMTSTVDQTLDIINHELIKIHQDVTN